MYVISLLVLLLQSRWTTRSWRWAIIWAIWRRCSWWRSNRKKICNVNRTTQDRIINVDFYFTGYHAKQYRFLLDLLKRASEPGSVFARLPKDPRSLLVSKDSLGDVPIPRPFGTAEEYLRRRTVKVTQLYLCNSQVRLRSSQQFLFCLTRG